MITHADKKRREVFRKAFELLLRHSVDCNCMGCTEIYDLFFNQYPLNPKTKS